MRLEELVQAQLVPERQTKQRGSQLPRPFQAHALDQPLGHLGIIRRRGDVGRKQFQLVPFTGLVEDFDRLQPSRLGRVI